MTVTANQHVHHQDPETGAAGQKIETGVINYTSAFPPVSDRGLLIKIFFSILKIKLRKVRCENCESHLNTYIIIEKRKMMIMNGE